MMFYFDWRLALFSVTSAPLVVYPLVRLGQRVRRSTRRSQEQLEHLSHLTAEAFTGHRIVKAFAAERHEQARFVAASEMLYRTNLKVTSTLSLLPPIMEFLGGVAIVLLLWYGHHQIASAAMTPGDFLAFIFAAFMLYTPIKRLSRVNANLQQASAAAHRIFELLDTHSEVKERPRAALWLACHAASSSDTSASRNEMGRGGRFTGRVVHGARWPDRGARRAERGGKNHARQSSCRGSTT